MNHRKHRILQNVAKVNGEGERVLTTFIVVASCPAGPACTARHDDAVATVCTPQPPRTLYAAAVATSPVYHSRARAIAAVAAAPAYGPAKAWPASAANTALHVNPDSSIGELD
jgi:hypothetical protein